MAAILNTDPTGSVAALDTPCPTCGATTAYRHPEELACVRCGTDRNTDPTPVEYRGGHLAVYRYIALGFGA